MPRIIFRKRYAVVRLVVTQCSIHFVVEITAVNKFERQTPCHDGSCRLGSSHNLLYLVTWRAKRRVRVGVSRVA